MNRNNGKSTVVRKGVDGTNQDASTQDTSSASGCLETEKSPTFLAGILAIVELTYYEGRLH